MIDTDTARESDAFEANNVGGMPTPEDRSGTGDEGREDEEARALPSYLAMEEHKSRTRTREWRSVLRPGSAYQEWLFDQIVLMSLRIDRLHITQDVHLNRQARRALRRRAWDADRRAAVELIALGMARRPASVVAQLEQTLHGCDWLLSAWRGLAQSQEGTGPGGTPGPLGEKERKIALDLLGVDPGRREGQTPLDLPSTAFAGEREHEGTAVADEALTATATFQAGLIAAQIARLLADRDGLVEDDAHDWRTARVGVAADTDPTSRWIKRDLNAAMRRMKSLLVELRYLQGRAGQVPSSADAIFDAYVKRGRARTQTNDPGDRDHDRPAGPPTVATPVSTTPVETAVPAAPPAQQQRSKEEPAPAPRAGASASRSPSFVPSATAASKGFGNPGRKLADAVNPAGPMNRRARLAEAARQKCQRPRS